ncbi:MAG: hypothetical protein ACI9X4_002506 [Glaciecola sp.]|jgi:hypothetical protein
MIDQLRVLPLSMFFDPAMWCVKKMAWSESLPLGSRLTKTRPRCVPVALY